MMTKREKTTAWLIGIGLVISVIHQPDQPLLKYIFLPQIGNLLILIVSAFYLLGLKREDITFGSKWLWIPLAVIILSMVARAIYATITGDTFWGLKAEWLGIGYGSGLFALYLASRKLGTEIFKPFSAGIIIASLSCIILGFVNPGVKSGGIISVTNYDMFAGFLVFGVLVSSLQSRWWLSAVAIVGLFFSGAEEGWFAVVILAGVVLVKRDWSRKLLLPVGALALTLMVCSPLGITQKLYLPSVERVAAVKEAVEDTEVGKTLDKIIPNIITNKVESYKPKISAEVVIPKIRDGNYPAIEVVNPKSKTELWFYEATGQRWLLGWRLSPIKPLGYGYNINNFYPGIPHNVPMIIVEQIGIIAAVAWLCAIIYLVIRTRWRYAWIGVMGLCVLDHFVWTTAAPWFWALAGVSSSANIKSDYIFRR